jgi:Cu+-exporting ATPase
MVASAEKTSEHPLGEAIVKEAEQNKMSFLHVTKFASIPGLGIEANIDNKNLLIGNQKLMVEKNIDFSKYKIDIDNLANQGKTPMLVAIDSMPSGIIAVADTVKQSSKSAITALKKLGIEVAMLTGDNSKTAKAIAYIVGVDRVLSEVLPHQKSNEVKRLQQEKKIVAMVGDGINDAPALAQADVGIAIGQGTDIAIESADVVLMKSDLKDVSTAIYLSKRTIRNVKQNLFWAFGYNVVGIPIAMGIWYLFGGPLMNPVIAALAMSLSSVSVITNALRLKRFKPLL